MSSTRSSSSVVSTQSSSESISDAGPRTPLDQQLDTPPHDSSLAPSQNMAISALYSRLELIPKRSNTAPAAVRANLSIPAHTQAAKIRGRDRTLSISSTASQASHFSQRSLLRKTLILATSSGLHTPNGSTPSLLTPRSSSSSLASTSVSSQTSIRNSRRNPNLHNPSRTPSISKPSHSSNPLDFSADPTTALTPTTSTSIAQFSPTPKAASTLLQFGISSTDSAIPPSSSNHLSKNFYRAPSVADDENHGSSFSSFYSAGLSSSMSMIWRGRRTDLPSISRALEPDSPELGSGLTGLDTPVHHVNGSGSGSGSLSTRAAAPGSSGHPIAATPRSTFPINSDPGSSTKSTPSSGSVSAGIHDKRHYEPRRSTLDPSSSQISFSSLDKGKGPARLGRVGRASTMDTIATRSIRFDTTATNNHIKDDKYTALPSLAAIESGSRLMRARIACVSCGEVGPDFPRCGRCGDAWCSRECRLSANNGGKHRCAPSA